MTLLSQISTLLDEAGGASFWTSAQLYTAANSTLLEVWAEGDWEEVSEQVVVGTSSSLVTLPSLTVMVPRYLEGLYGRSLITTHAKLEQYSRQWKQAEREYPKHFLLWDAFHLRPFPLPDREYAFDVHGIPWPEEINSTNDDVDVDPLLREAIAHLAAAELMSYTQPKVAEETRAEGQRLLHNYRVRQRNSQSHSISRLRPAGMFGTAQGGSVRIGRRLQ